jgi:hypothetical protein
MAVRVTTGEHFNVSSCPPGPGKVAVTVRWAKTRLQHRAMALLPRWIMWPSRVSLALSVRPRTAFRSASAVRLGVSGGR